jgi:hypothetical protein
MTDANEQETDRAVFELLATAEIGVINLGLRRFAETFEQQGLRFVHVDWRPPPDNQNDLASILQTLNR